MTFDFDNHPGMVIIVLLNIILSNHKKKKNLGSWNNDVHTWFNNKINHLRIYGYNK